MKTRFGIIAALTLVAGAVSGCSSDPNDVGLPDLVGDYSATKLEFVSVANPADKFDAIQAGVTVDLGITAGGGYTLTVHQSGSPDDITTGTVVLDGNKITLQSSDPATGTFALHGNTLSFHLTTGVEYDFDMDGTDDPATADVVFQRT